MQDTLNQAEGREDVYLEGQMDIPTDSDQEYVHCYVLYYVLLEMRKLQQVCYLQADIGMCLHCLVRLDDNKSVTSC